MANQEFTLSQEFLNKIFEYRDGELYWKVQPSHSVKAGDKAGCFDKYNGYYIVRLAKKMYGLHRIVFAMHHGYFPEMVDHIDRNPANNRIENLRPVNNQQNQWNTNNHASNTSGYKNVMFRKDRNKWVCRIKINGKHIMRGAFDTAEEANIYANELRKQLHGEYAI